LLACRARNVEVFHRLISHGIAKFSAVRIFSLTQSLAGLLKFQRCGFFTRPNSQHTAAEPR
jgi:hypothetical protein